jgi:hypothetical protein
MLLLIQWQSGQQQRGQPMLKRGTEKTSGMMGEQISRNIEIDIFLVNP